MVSDVLEHARWQLCITKREPVSLIAATPDGHTWQVYPRVPGFYPDPPGSEYD
jgi:hypothetical protein